MRRVIMMLAALAFASAQSPPNLRTIHRGEAKEFTALAAGSIFGPTRCDASGAVYFRAYRRGSLFSVPVSRVSQRDDKVLEFDLSKVPEDAVPRADSLTFTDFAPAGGTLYIPAVNEEENRSFVLRFSAGDGRWLGTTALQPGFDAFKIAAFNSGAFVASGAMLQEDAPGKTKGFTHYAALYDPTGRWVKQLGSLQLGTDGTKSEPVGQEHMPDTTMNLMESSGTLVYFLQPGPPTVIYTFQESGATDIIRDLWTPGADYVPTNMRVTDSLLWIEYVKDPAKEGKPTKYVVYDLFTKQPVSMDEKADDLHGAFACYDGSATYLFLTNHNGHRYLLSGVAR